MSIENRLIKYATAGGANYAALYWLSNGASTMEIFGQTVPLWAAAIGLGAASSAVNDAVHTWMLPYLPLPDKLKDTSGIALSLGAGAASSVGLLYLGSPKVFNSIPAAKLAGIGAATEVASEWLYQKVAGLAGIDQKDMLLY